MSELTFLILFVECFMALFWIIHLAYPYFKHIESYNILFYECGIVWKVIYRTRCISVGYTMLPFIRVCIIMCILVHLTKNSQHICFASSNHNKVKEKKCLYASTIIFLPNAAILFHYEPLLVEKHYCWNFEERWRNQDVTYTQLAA